MNIFIRVAIFIAIITFGIFYFTAVTSLSGSGRVMADLKERLTALEKARQSKSMVLSQQSLLSDLEKEAKNQGMILDAHFLYIKSPSSLAVSKQ